jgi:multidrug efflux pump subunit AcrA (membrane-fusion protein)
MTATILAIALLLQVNAPSDSDRYAGQPTDPVVKGLIKVTDQIKLPAKEPGVLVHLAVKEGSLVRAGQEIGKIDDSEPQMQKKASGYKLRGAIKRYTDDVDIRYAEAGAAVAKADYEMILETNRLADKAVAQTEVRAKKLEWDKMILMAEKSRHEKELAKFEAYTQKAEVEAADMAIERRLITAPFDGVVEELNRKQDEWVNPGDTILRLFRMDTMQVEGAVAQSQYDPHELQGCEVSVEVEMARGRKETFRGRITKISSIIRGDGMYNVRAEIANREEHGNWMLRDGLPATMTIHLGTEGQAATAGVSRAQ